MEQLAASQASIHPLWTGWVRAGGAGQPGHCPSVRSKMEEESHQTDTGDIVGYPDT